MLSLRGLVDQKWSVGENSYCEHCGGYGSIIENIGELPDPQLYGSWLMRQQEAEEKARAEEKSAANLRCEKCGGRLVSDPISEFLAQFGPRNGR